MPERSSRWIFRPSWIGGSRGRRAACPLSGAHVAGTRSGPWFRHVREFVLTWFPHAEDVVINGADHSLALTHPAQIAGALHPFLRRHPL